MQAKMASTRTPSANSTTLLFSFFLLLVIATKGSASVLLMQPIDLTVVEGQTAVFTCTISCSHTSTYWSIGTLPSFYRSINAMSRMKIALFKRKTGMTVGLTRNRKCDSTHNGNYTETLRILGETRFDKTTLQCMAVDFSSNVSSPIVFSRYAVMTVKGNSSSNTPFISPTSCPSPATGTMSETPDRETVVSTVTVTITPTPVVVTRFVTVTIGLPSESPDQPSLNTLLTDNARSSGMSRLLRLPSLSLLASLLLPIAVVALGSAGWW